MSTSVTVELGGNANDRPTNTDHRIRLPTSERTRFNECRTSTDES